MAASSPKRTRLTAGERREQLLEEATALVLERGFHDVSIDGVAKRAGITRAVVYQHFDDLTELLQAVIERAADSARQQVSEATLEDPASADPRDLMLQSVRAYIAVVTGDPDTWRLVLCQPEGVPADLRDTIANARTQLLAQITRQVLPIFAESSDAELTARILATIADQYAHLALEDPKKYPPERLLEHADWMIAGFLAEAG